jgi:hypothetical protein
MPKESLEKDKDHVSVNSSVQFPQRLLKAIELYYPKVKFTQDTLLKTAQTLVVLLKNNKMGSIGDQIVDYIETVGHPVNSSDIKARFSLEDKPLAEAIENLRDVRYTTKKWLSREQGGYFAPRIGVTIMKPGTFKMKRGKLPDLAYVPLDDPLDFTWYHRSDAMLQLKKFVINRPRCTGQILIDEFSYQRDGKSLPMTLEILKFVLVRCKLYGIVATRPRKNTTSRNRRVVFTDYTFSAANDLLE